MGVEHIQSLIINYTLICTKKSIATGNFFSKKSKTVINHILIVTITKISRVVIVIVHEFLCILT